MGSTGLISTERGDRYLGKSTPIAGLENLRYFDG
jgi:hypothetical protein